MGRTVYKIFEAVVVVNEAVWELTFSEGWVGCLGIVSSKRSKTYILILKRDTYNFPDHPVVNVSRC